MSLEPILLDTCAVIWTGLNQSMDPNALDEISRAYSLGNDTYVSPITAWELGLLYSRGRLALPTHPMVFFTDVCATPGMRQCALTDRILMESSFLPGSPHTDPADRIMIATARTHGLRIMTRDARILDYADKGHVLALAC